MNNFIENVKLLKDLKNAPTELINFPRQTFHNLFHAWVDLVTPIAKFTSDPEQVARALEWFGH